MATYTVTWRKRPDHPWRIYGRHYTQDEATSTVAELRQLGYEAIIQPGTAGE